MKHRGVSILIILLTLSISSPAFGGTDKSSPRQAKVIPFRLDRNRIIIPTRVNLSDELNIILDSGMPMDGVYLFKKYMAEYILSDSSMDVRVPGAGEGKASQAVMAENQTLAAGDMVFDSQMVVVSRSDYTQSFPTDGVIGWTLFGHHIVDINFDESIITLRDSGSFRPDDTWHEIDLTLKENIPWMSATVATIENEEVPIEVYFDIASGDALELLISDEMKVTSPGELGDEYLATGLSGDIRGSRGRSHMFKIGPYVLYDIPTVMARAEVRSRQDGADAIIGCHLLTRFNVVFDYFESKLYIKPNEMFDQPFE